MPFPAAGVVELGLDESQTTPVGPDVLSARIDVPPGEWLLWPNHGSALWIGQRVDALPGAIRTRLINAESVDLVAALNELADAGVWLREGALFADGVWGPSQRPEHLRAWLDTDNVAALSGIFVDRDGRSGRLEVATGGIWWTDRPTLAIQWRLITRQLTAPQ